MDGLWEARIARAVVLAGRYPFAQEVLAFFGQVARFQKSVAEDLIARPPEGAFATRFADAVDTERWLEQVPPLLELAMRSGTPVLASSAADLLAASPEEWKRMLLSAWESSGTAVEGTRESAVLFSRALLQPYAATAAQMLPRAQGRMEPGVCPACGGKPVAGALRKEALGAKRSLICSFCLTEWECLRVLCPNCGEGNFEALPVFTTEPFEHIRINACDTCRTYIKTVDLTKDGHAIPEVDELAALPLSLWAQEKGYTRLHPNLLGT